MSFSTSTTRVFTALLAAGAAVAKPIAKSQSTSPDLGAGIPTASGLTITSLTYYGDGCPQGSLRGEFCSETSSFNVSISELNAILQDGQPSDDSSCHIEVGFKTESQIQLNLLQGDFYGSVFLECEGMTALAHSSVSFAGSASSSNIPWLFNGPIDTKAVYEHNLVEVFASQCSTGGDVLMLIDLVLHVTRGPAAQETVGYVDINELTGAISQAYVLQPSPCGQTVQGNTPSSTLQQYGGSFGKEQAEQLKKTGKISGGYSSTSKSNEEETEKSTGGAGGGGYGYSTSSNNNEEEKKKGGTVGGGYGYSTSSNNNEEEKKKGGTVGGGYGYSTSSINNEEESGAGGYTTTSKSTETGKEEEEEEERRKEEEERKKEEEEKKKKEEEEKKKEEEEEKKKEEEEEKEKKEKEEKKEEEETKTTGGGGGGYTGGNTAHYSKEEIEKKKNGGDVCGQKCSYIPCTQEEEDRKVGGFSEFEKQAYFEAKESYKLSLQLEYNKETSYQEQKTPTEDQNKYLKHDQGNKNDYTDNLFRTRLMQEEGGEKSKGHKKDKCKRGEDGCNH
ncbi:hypothetical protein BKA81DRAFT_430503 [Phyllosticta paracitricarpa]|uniref:Uncharacterized protein n=1 Tax=Phyllosticta paracitricarpa TaxID=2016321 RepID=A0ABR1N7J4_9PEZI